jgi:hypothetical protein
MPHCPPPACTLENVRIASTAIASIFVEKLGRQHFFQIRTNVHQINSFDGRATGATASGYNYDLCRHGRKMLFTFYATNTR